MVRLPDGIGGRARLGSSHLCESVCYSRRVGAVVILPARIKAASGAAARRLAFIGHGGGSFLGSIQLRFANRARLSSESYL